LTETRLRMTGARIFDELHVTGHAYREDHYDFIHMLNPQHIIPSHGGLEMTAAYAEFASELGYTLQKDVHLMTNGQRLLVHK
ncbi:MBL fold metallo-hydrolase RNA specificity domain-containing protein, partial [Methanocalculus sp.]|uniref:MBL fold metallo-hydrolase RNA specificity domain-containing protein n=1 Tax=Methanocalculus sp. TaxID=2004547 RepID=UPI0017937C1F